VSAGVSTHGSTRTKREASATKKHSVNSSADNESAPKENDVHIIFVGRTFSDSDWVQLIFYQVRVI